MDRDLLLPPRRPLSELVRRFTAGRSPLSGLSGPGYGSRAFGDGKGETIQHPWGEEEETTPLASGGGEKYLKDREWAGKV